MFYEYYTILKTEEVYQSEVGSLQSTDALSGHVDVTLA